MVPSFFGVLIRIQSPFSNTKSDVIDITIDEQNCWGTMHFLIQ
jgi:hypothetical protein